MTASPQSDIIARLETMQWNARPVLLAGLGTGVVLLLTAGIVGLRRLAERVSCLERFQNDVFSVMDDEIARRCHRTSHR